MGQSHQSNEVGKNIFYIVNDRWYQNLTPTVGESDDTSTSSCGELLSC